MAKGLWRKLRALTRQRKDIGAGAAAAASGAALRGKSARPLPASLAFRGSVLEPCEDRVLMSIAPTASEQLMFEFVNRMRSDPQGELFRLTNGLGTQATSSDPNINAALDFFNVNGIELQSQWSELVPAAPLAWNESLINVAITQNQAMIAANLQSHDVPGQPDFRTRFNNQGYSPFSTIGENIFAAVNTVLEGHAGLAIDWGFGPGGIQSPAGHRDSIMNPDFREVGIAITPESNPATDNVGPLVVSQDFGGVSFPVPQAIIVGVVINDLDSDAFYDINEGLGGVTVDVVGTNGTPGSFSTTSFVTGGWQQAVPAGTYNITFSGGGLAQPVVRSNIVVGADNVKIDNVFSDIAIEGNSIVISDGDTTPGAGDHTSFGGVDITSGTGQRTFTVRNTGNAILNLTTNPRVRITGANAADFTLTTAPASTVAVNGTTTFTVTFNPSAAGTRNAVIEVSNNDTDEGLYTFAVAGEGAAEPEIDVRGNAVSIADGDATPDAADHTAFGNANINSGTVTRTFTIHNLGSGTLNLTGNPLVSVTGANAGEFTVTQLPASSIAPAGSTTFQVTFDPSATGTRTATINIQSDDSDETLYTFDVSGAGVDPEIEVRGNNVVISDGDTTPATTDFTDFRQIGVTSTATSTVTRTFTIRNTNATELTIAGVTITGANAADFTVTSTPAATVAGGGSTTFTVTFNPSAAGLRTATVTVTSNDADEASYDFSVQGTGITTTTAGNGLQSATLEAGTGNGATTGQAISVRYTGYLTTGEQFDSNVGGNPFNFTLGAGSVISGWDTGLVGMKVGEKRTLVIPPALAYGNNPPAGSGIPQNAVLIFEVERLGPGDIAVGSPQGSNVVNIVSGDVTPSLTDHTDFGNTTLGGGSTSWSFRVSATGAINLTGSPRVAFSGPDAAAFSLVATNPATPAAALPGNTSDFSISFNPTRAGLHTATVTIQSDDPDEGTFTFAVQGTGIPNRIPGATEDTNFTVTHALLNTATHETGTHNFRIESVEAGVLLKNGVPIVPGVTTLSTGESLVWQPPANGNHTIAAFTVKFFDGTNTLGDALPIRIEVTPVDEAAIGTINDITVGGAAQQNINLATVFSDPDIIGTIVRMTTSLGNIDVHLFDPTAPATVANFLNYVNGGDYNNTVFHRVLAGFIAQAGGFLPQLPATHIATDPAVVNEFKNSSQRGTIAMAKVGNLPDSATSEWFFNLVDNANNLDNQNNGFTVFGEVIGTGMTVVDAIAAVPVFSGAGFSNIPLRNFTSGTPTNDNYVIISNVAVIPKLTFEVIGNTNPALVTTSLNGNTLNVTVNEGVFGTGDVTVRVTDATGRQMTETFTVGAVSVNVTAIDALAGEPSDGQPANPGVFRITRAGPTTDALDVDFVLTGTAVNGTDYATVTQTATIPAGQTFVDVTITPLTDAESEGIENVTLTLSPFAGYTITGTGNASLDVVDDKPIVEITAIDAAAAETNAGQAANPATFRITRSGSTNAALTVNLTVTGTATNGADYAQIPTSVEIPAGQTFVDIALNVTNDAIAELDETTTLTVAPSASYIIAGDGTETATIIDNEAVLVTIAATDNTVAEGTPATDTGTIRISRTGSLAGALNVNITRAGVATFGQLATNDYRQSVGGANLTTAVVTIPAGQSFVDVITTATDDATPEPTEALTMTLAAGTGYVLPAVVADRTVTLNLADNEPIVSVSSIGFIDSDAAASETATGEAVDRAFFRIERTGSTAAALTVNFTIGTTPAPVATRGTDYTLRVNDVIFTTNTVTIPAGQDHIDVFVNPINDTLPEAIENVVMNLAAGTTYTLAADAADRTATATIVDNEPEIRIETLDAAAAESGSPAGNTATFRIHRTQSTAGPLTVNFTVGTTPAPGGPAATRTTDYVLQKNNVTFTTNTVTIDAGQAFVDVVVVPVDDALAEVTESVTLNLAAGTTYTLDPDTADRTGTATIADNEPIVSIAAIDNTAAESGTPGTETATFRISRTTNTGNLTVNLTRTGTATFSSLATGGDYGLTGGINAAGTSVVIPDGASFVDVTLTPREDALNELTESATLTLAALTTYTLDPVVANRSATANILDNEVRTLSINDITVTEGNAGTLNANFTVTLSSAMSQTVTVDVATADGTATAGTDYVALPLTTLTFAPGQVSKTVTVLVNGDVIDEDNQTFNVNLSNAQSTAPVAIAAGAAGIGTGTITDNDAAPTIAIADAAVNETDAGTVTAAFNLTLSAPSEKTITVRAATGAAAGVANTLATSNVDFTALPATTFTFTPGQTSQPVNVTVLSDNLAENNEKFAVNLTLPTNATIADAQGIGTINDDDQPTISINDVTVTEPNLTAPTTINATFNITLSHASTVPVTVKFATAPNTATATTDYTTLALTTLTFNPGETSKNVNVVVKGDVLDEIDETFFVNLSAATAATIADAQGIGTITDNDATPTLSVADVSIIEGDSGVKNLVFTVKLSAASGQTVSVDVATADGTATGGTAGVNGADYTSVATTSLVFTPGQTSKTVNVAIAGDLTPENSETILFNLTNAVNATIADGQGVGTITSDEFAPATIAGLTMNGQITGGNSGNIGGTFQITFNNDGTFTTLDSEGSGGGTFTYTKTGKNTGRLNITDDEGAAVVNITFTSIINATYALTRGVETESGTLMVV